MCLYMHTSCVEYNAFREGRLSVECVIGYELYKLYFLLNSDLKEM